jgi:hypothetical protein
MKKFYKLIPIILVIMAGFAWAIGCSTKSSGNFSGGVIRQGADRDGRTSDPYPTYK